MKLYDKQLVQFSLAEIHITGDHGVSMCLLKQLKHSFSHKQGHLDDCFKASLTVSIPGGELGLPVDGDMPPRHPFWTQKSGGKTTKMEAKNPGIINALELLYLFFVDIVRCKSDYWCKLKWSQNNSNLRSLTFGFVSQIVENKPKNPWIVIFFEKLTLKSGSYCPKKDPFWRHVPVPLYRGVPPGGLAIKFQSRSIAVSDFICWALKPSALIHQIDNSFRNNRCPIF